MKIFKAVLLSLICAQVFAQVAPIQNYSIDHNGRVRLQISSSAQKYYILRVRHHPDSAFTEITSLTWGKSGTTTITEPLRAYPLNHYQVFEYDKSSPVDSDGDGHNDISEYNSMPIQGPFSAASSIQPEHGLVCLNTVSAFSLISSKENYTPWVQYLNGMEYVKFIIHDFYSSSPRVYFINSNNFVLHADFANYMGISHTGSSVIKGQLIYHPNVLAPNGSLGTYTFTFSNNEAKDFSAVRRCQELLAANMPFINNNLAYFITQNNEQEYQQTQSLYLQSRVHVVYETDVYAGINYWGFNQSEGFGYFRKMMQGQVPDLKDIVLCEFLPNSLPRVGGVITSVIQTPLSHVNLRAIHYKIPNAFIRNPLDNENIVNLLDHYIYFKTSQSSYEIREATIDEFNYWFENIRPKEEQTPPLNLSYTEIIPLSDIQFGMFDGFGAKTTNLATLKTFGFPEETVPDGFGIPFYFYQEFMQYNGFFDEINEMIQMPDFKSDRTFRSSRLAQLRAAIKNASMPNWMIEKLTELQMAFPSGISIRCRSSSNNEDLPGFSGAGLYDSKTHHPNEGHISKTIKQIFASLWNLRAFEEREFNRVNHFVASMGVLCHPNFKLEKVNGVGVTADPVYNTQHNFYINSQLGEELITNPSNAYPEEVLIKKQPVGNDDFLVIQYSSLVPQDSLLMSVNQMEQLRIYFNEIHNRFAVLYQAKNNPSFAMDIEFKVDKDHQLVIKQARPWVSFVPEKAEPMAELKALFKTYPNPAADFINVFNPAKNGELHGFMADMQGRHILHGINIPPSGTTIISTEHLPAGIYVLTLFDSKGNRHSEKIIKN